ncbi:MAG: AmmeMemoRadiSam system protein B [Ignavibacteriales bacterium]|nr:MAG: AmmeMemoRadiSam system protein B [Ignavibacteriales bacterium]
MNDVRTSAVAGMFYPSDPFKLRSMVRKLMESAAQVHSEDHMYGIAVPHAGYMYSGYTAACSFASVMERNYKHIIILSPSHYELFEGCSVCEADVFETPLGLMPVDRELAEELMKHTDRIFFSKRGHGREHGIEVELPFIQYIWGDVSIVPLVMGSQDDGCISALAEGLRAAALRKDILIITSTDLSHFYKKKQADRLDAEVEREINAMNPGELDMKFKTGTAEACGGGLLLSHMKALKHIPGIKGKVLYRTDSSESSGDTDSVVGYLSAVFYA